MQTMTLAAVLEMLVALRDATVGQPPPNEEFEFMGFCLERVSRSQAQILQDLWVAWELGSPRDGYFVEFGAADGRKYSNTWYLETELGWRGVLAEPARIWQPALARNRTCAIDRRCVWTETGRTLTFNQPAIAAHATIDAYSDSDSLADTRKDGLRYEVETVSLNDLLTHWDAPRRIDYLSIDTEGSELDILTAFDFDAWDVRLITVEHNHTPQRQGLFDLLTAKGYRRRFKHLSSVDDWYVKPA
jgi:FkbM family methyltransferase